MTKETHQTIRLERDDLLAFEAIAEARGLSVPEHLRTLPVIMMMLSSVLPV